MAVAAISLLLLIVVVTGVCTLLYVRPKARWERARAIAQWEVYTTVGINVTVVGVHKIARLGDRTEILDPGQTWEVPREDTDLPYHVRLVDAEGEANAIAMELNTS